MSWVVHGASFDLLRMTPEFIATLPTEALMTLSRYYADVARLLELRALEMARRRDRELAAEGFLQRAFDAAESAIASMDRGTSPDVAVSAAAGAYALDPGVVAAHVKNLWKQAEVERRGRRDIEIVRMAARGRSNKEIAKIVGCCPRTVSRVIDRAFRENRVYLPLSARAPARPGNRRARPRPEPRAQGGLP